MVVFELYRQLDIRMFMTVAVMDRNFGALSKYIMQGDCMILLGSDHSVRLNMSNRAVTVDASVTGWDIDSEPQLWFSEDSAESCVIRLINNAFRQWLEIDPFPSVEEFEAVSEELNERLSYYHLRVFFDSNSLSVFHDENVVTFEEALEIIMEVDTETEADKFMPEWYTEAEYLRASGQLSEAAKRYERILKHTDGSMQLNTVCSFRLAEVYYFLGNNERAVTLYYRCNPEFIDDNRDFFIHLGHALLDSRMKKYERQLRIYYRASLDEQYAQEHSQAVRAASRDIASVFSDYEDTCYEMGERKYHEHRRNLPPEADDIDELLLEEAVRDRESPSDSYIKRYEQIRLIEPTFVRDSGRSQAELISDAYDSFTGGDYQNAFLIYCRLRDELDQESDVYTWVMLQLGKLYCIFDEYEKALNALSKCDPDKFGVIYRKDDFLLLYEHVRIVCDDFESDLRFRSLIRGRIDSYYAQYDRTYLSLQGDSALMNSYALYEIDCMDNAMDDFISMKEKMGDSKGASPKGEQKRKGLFKGLSRFFHE